MNTLVLSRDLFPLIGRILRKMRRIQSRCKKIVQSKIGKCIVYLLLLAFFAQTGRKVFS